MAFDGWNKPNSEVTPELVNHIGKVVSKLISKNGGKFTGKIGDIMQESGITDDREYGTVLQAVRESKDKFGFSSEKKGPKGSVYWFDKEPTEPKQPEKAHPLPLASFDLTVKCPHCHNHRTITIQVSEKTSEVIL